MSTREIDGRSDTRYSQDVPGASGNFDQPVRFDWTGGYVGITQWHDANKQSGRIERILLSNEQVKALQEFIQRRGR